MDLAEVQVLVACGRYLRALDYGEHLGCDEERPVAERVEALLLACRAAGALRRSFAARDLAQMALALAGGQEPLATQARLYLGMALGDLGEHEAALAQFVAVQEASRAPAHRRRLGQALYHMALAYERLKRIDHALEVYEQACQAYDQAGYTQGVVRCRQNAAWLLLTQGQTAEGVTLLWDVAPLMPSATEEQRCNQLALTAFALMDEDPAEARSLCEELLATERTVNAWARACAAYVSARLLLARGQRTALRQCLAEVAGTIEAARDTRLFNLFAALRAEAEPA